MDFELSCRIFLRGTSRCDDVTRFKDNSRQLHPNSFSTAEFHLSGRWLYLPPITRTGLGLRADLSRILQK